MHGAPSSGGDSDTLPTIAIVSNYDSLAAAPGLASGLDHNASGAIALLELSRIFAELYAEFRTHGSYNLLFILASVDRLNFAGTKNWLRNSDSRVLESLEFALCLERLASPGSTGASPLYLHVSKLPKTPEIQQIYNHFTATAAERNIPFEIVHQKINISVPQVFWQHEQFSRKRIVAATLSSQKESAGVWEGASILDGIHSVDLTLLARNIRFVAEALGKQIYGLPDRKDANTPLYELLDPVTGVNTAFLNASIRFYAQSPRLSALIDNSKTDPVLQSLDNHFSKTLQDYKKQTFNLDQIQGGAGSAASAVWKFYKDVAGGKDTTRPRVGVVEMHAFQVKPILFDVYLSLAILAYLLVLYIACKQPSNISDVIAILIGK